MNWWKGTVLHEMTHLPPYWYRLWQKTLAAKLTQKAFPAVQRIAYGRRQRQYILIAPPKIDTGKWVIYWHGGGWQFGSPEKFLLSAKCWLDAGYGVVLPSYRRIPLHNFSHIEQDTIAGLRAFRDWSGGTVAGKEIQLLFLGVSAGGHIAAVAGLKRNICEAAGLADAKIQGVLSCGGVVDFDFMRSSYVTRSVAGGKKSKLYQATNPITWLRADAPPFQLIHGTHDGLVPLPVAESFSKKYEGITKRAAPLYVIQGKTHLDIGRWIYQNDEVRKLLLARAEEWTKSV